MIRDYTPADLEPVVSVWFTVAKAAYHFLSDDVIQSIRNDIEHKYLPSPAAHTWVCEQDKELVGFITLIDNVVGGLFVLPDYQHIGIGKALIEHAKVTRKTISLDVLKESTKVLRFYERCGFIPTKQGICPITSLPTVTMELTG